jgi:hypothetical protein
MVAKPGQRFEWAPADPTQIVDPGAAKKAEGWNPSEPPPAQYFNWAWDLIAQWLLWSEQSVDVIQAIPQAIVGDATRTMRTHANTVAGLQQAITDAGPYGLIQILDGIQFDGVVQLTQAGQRIEIHPRAIMSKNGAASALRVSSDDVRIVGGKWTGFNAGGDKAIYLDNPIVRFMITQAFFVGNDTHVDDGGNVIVDFGNWKD